MSFLPFSFMQILDVCVLLFFAPLPPDMLTPTRVHYDSSPGALNCSLNNKRVNAGIMVNNYDLLTERSIDGFHCYCDEINPQCKGHRFFRAKTKIKWTAHVVTGLLWDHAGHQWNCHTASNIAKSMTSEVHQDERRMKPKGNFKIFEIDKNKDGWLKNLNVFTEIMIFFSQKALTLSL